MNGREPFVFYTERRLVLLTERRAQNLHELHDHLQRVSGSSIFYHTHHQYLSHHFERPMFFNDFAEWVRRALQEKLLAERLAAVDLLALTSVRQVREALIAVIGRHIEEGGDAARPCPAGDEFHFCESQSFVMPTGLIARDADEFVARIAEISNVSLFFHFFEARLRLGRPSNDFSQWLLHRGCVRLARAIDQLDPYIMTLDEMRDRIVRLGREEGST